MRYTLLFCFAGRAGAYIWRQQGTQLHISCSSSYIDDTSPFVITINGSWKLTSESNTNGATLNISGNTTTITLPYYQLANQSVILTLSADLNDSGHIDTDDLLLMGLQWLNTPATPSADIAPGNNGDGQINNVDFYLLSQDWLK